MNHTEGGPDEDGNDEYDQEAQEVTQHFGPSKTLADELGSESENDEHVEDGLQVDGAADDTRQEESDIGITGESENPEDTPDMGPRTPPIGSPADSGSIPDDTPSVSGTPASLTLRVAASPSARGSISRTASGALQPFERRFQSRFSSGPAQSPSRSGSPAFLGNHSRQSSLLSVNASSTDGDALDIFEAPWEVVRWTKLRKISGQAFSEVGKRQFGSPTCLAVSATIVIGTSKGLILLFDYHQTLKHIIGQGTKATECGAITSLALAADHSTIASGHASGNIFTWEISKPAQPFLHIPPIPRSNQENLPDGHVPDRAVLHVGFLGTRHTALVSADDGGMAFSHLATRGFGSLGRSVKTTRLLGRYSSLRPQEDTQRKPSSVLAFAPLPLGNVEQATDGIGLTALLTPYLLVVVSTTPVAQTQYKSPRPKDIMAHSAVSGCLAWFPSVKLKTPIGGKDVSDAKLVYCWSNIMMVLDVETSKQDPADKEKLPGLVFRQRSRWVCEEAIVAVQWLSRSVIGALTISQRLVVIEDGELHFMDSVDLLQRHIYHRDFFSEQLHTVVERSEHEAYMHGVVADAFLMSFRAYKGRIFLLGFSDISVGTLSNWADRITALVENGNDIGAIRLAVAYYGGSTGRVSVGLPENEAARHEMVKERLIELLTASLRYRLSASAPEESRLDDLISECFSACLMMDDVDFLLDDVYDLIKDANQESGFLDLLESYIMDDEITTLPPTLVKDLVTHFVSRGRETRLEEILCRLDAHMFDIDEVTKLCKRHLLYDALIYVWNTALADWVTPLIELLALINDRDYTKGPSEHTEEDRLDTANKVFSYLAYSFTGRIYPKGEFMDEDQAVTVKRDLYKFLFSGTVMAWPPGSRSVVHTHAREDEEPSFPYLCLLLAFDTSSFMSMLNEAFEDPFLNANQQQDYDGSFQNGTYDAPGKTTRQQIISILLGIMTEPDFTSAQTIYLDMFVARSLPKYPQFMILSGSSLQQILHRLCTFDAEDLGDECQLSVEYLLSVYHPPVTPDLIQLLRKAGFYRVLKSVYRSERRYLELLDTYFADHNETSAIFDDLPMCLRSTVSPKQKTAIEQLILRHATQLAFIDLAQTAHLLSEYTSHIMPTFLENLSESRLQFAFLRALLEPALGGESRVQTLLTVSDGLVSQFGEQYIRLMCQHDPSHVADYVKMLKTGDLKLDRILPAMEANGVVDAAVLLLAQDGLARDAMERLIKHLQSLGNGLCSLIEASSNAPDLSGYDEALTDLVESIDKYVKLGIWLCQGQTKIAEKTRQPRPALRPGTDVKESDLELDEYLWLILLDSIVTISKQVTASTPPSNNDTAASNTVKTASAIHAIVQQLFTAVLTSTSSSNPNPNPSSATTSHSRPRQSPPNQSFLYIFRLFLTRTSTSTSTSTSTPSLASLRSVLSNIFAAYAHESAVLGLANDLLGHDTFASLSSAHVQRQRGWRWTWADERDAKVS